MTKPYRSVMTLFCSLALLIPAGQMFGGDWPQLYGPRQDATSAETGLLDEWPEEGPPELWRHDVGVGFAGSAVVGGEVFLLDREQGQADVLRVFDLDTGEELWTYRYEAAGRVNFPGSRSTPSVTDTHVYTTGCMGDIHAINRETHEPDWSFNIYDRYPDDNRVFGYGPSPVMVSHEDEALLLVTPTAQGAPVCVAVSPATGETIWESDAALETFHSFHTPVIRTIGGVRGIACRDRTHVYFIDIGSGDTIWEHQAYELVSGPHVTIPPVTVFGQNNDRVFVTNGYENGSVLLDAQFMPGIGQWRVFKMYRIPEGGQVHPAIVVGGTIYLNINENDNLRGRNPDGGLACIDAATGQLMWKTENNPNLNRGATLYVDDKLIAFDGETGELLLINPDIDGLEIVSSFLALEPLGSNNNAWSPLVLSDGRLIIRDQRQIACYDLRDSPDAAVE